MKAVGKFPVRDFLLFIAFGTVVWAILLVALTILGTPPLALMLVLPVALLVFVPILGAVLVIGILQSRLGETVQSTNAAKIAGFLLGLPGSLAIIYMFTEFSQGGG